jgi:hypothetical protein
MSTTLVKFEVTSPLTKNGKKKPPLLLIKKLLPMIVLKEVVTILKEGEEKTHCCQ